MDEYAPQPVPVIAHQRHVRLRQEYERNQSIAALLIVLHDAAWFDPEFFAERRRLGWDGRPLNFSARARDPDEYVPVPRWAAQAIVRQVGSLLASPRRSTRRGRHARWIRRYQTEWRHLHRFLLLQHFRESVPEATVDELSRAVSDHLVAMAMPLLDNLDLDALARTAETLTRWTFLFVAAPLPLKDTDARKY